MKRVEKLAKELFTTVIKKHPKKHQDWDLVRADIQEYWCDIARVVFIRDIEARIDSLTKLPCGSFDSTPYRDKEIATLTATLNQKPEMTEDALADFIYEQRTNKYSVSLAKAICAKFLPLKGDEG